MVNGRPEKCTYNYIPSPVAGQQPIAILNGCRPISPWRWWDSGARLRQARLRLSVTESPSYFGASPWYAGTLHWFALTLGQIGVAIWNPLVANVVTRVLLALVLAVAVLYMAKTILAWVAAPFLPPKGHGTDGRSDVISRE